MQQFLYPASHEFEKLTTDAINTKIARHSSCTACDAACSGLRPSPIVTVVADDSEELIGSGDVQYLSECACGHGLQEHEADEGLLGRDEYIRRARVSIRLDELLSVSFVVFLHPPCRDS
ncbi:hypothetical protein SCHPADRAFT_192365 [Schizopora paradoxa]|uniref:Uncharacterized protein n=1 Tax=Schizopora paradoxa TaxID=27342 RepID=A0A0H2SIS7_9AGAM|nr:hypothetical protein SCHPADRAFT_192365 [Schizopora paradoxa]